MPYILGEKKPEKNTCLLAVVLHILGSRKLFIEVNLLCLTQTERKLIIQSIEVLQAQNKARRRVKGVKRERKLSFSIFRIPFFACSWFCAVLCGEVQEKQTINDGNVLKID
jgi:hypothetical protein